MKKLQKQRWDHACKIFSQMNVYLKEKWLVFDEGNNLLDSRTLFQFNEELTEIGKFEGHIFVVYFNFKDLNFSTIEYEKKIKLKAWGFINPLNVKRFCYWSK